MAGIFTRFMTKELGWVQHIEVTTRLCMKSRSCLPLSVEASFQALYLKTPEIDLAGTALDKRESGFDGIERHANLSRPLIGCPAWEDPNDALLLLALHHSVHDRIDGPIAPMSNDQVIALLSSPGGQCDAVPTILDQGIVSFPSRRREHSDDIGQPGHVLPCPGIHHQKGTFPTHNFSPCDAPSISRHFPCP